MTMLYQIVFSKLKVSTSTGSDCEPMRKIAYSKMNTSIFTTTTEFKQEQNGTPFGKRNQFVAVMSIKVCKLFFLTYTVLFQTLCKHKRKV